MIKIFNTTLISLLFASSTWAVPQMQLDIAGGSYNTAEETIVANSSLFTLHAIHKSLAVGATTKFYISAAVTPMNSLGAFGSFSINGVTYSAGSGMQYGTPPVDNAIRDIGSHGVFPTYYAEIEFVFNPANRATEYNTELNPGGLTVNPSGTSLFNSFTVDVSGLSPNYAIHFDFYDTYIKSYKNGMPVLGDFAPFSHDAESGPGGVTEGPVSVPEGGATILLLMGSLLGMAQLRRKTSKG